MWHGANRGSSLAIGRAGCRVRGCISHPGGQLWWMGPLDYLWVALSHGTNRQRLDWDTSNDVDDPGATVPMPALVSGL
jgi:hypothetical protein